MNIETFVFLDSETTGLPIQENNRTRMTELCLVAVQSDHLRAGVFPRVQNKINLCFNPQKNIDPKASEITGLTNVLLEFQPAFNLTSYGIMHEFLNMLKKPVCLVAHNGDMFDYPILKAEISQMGKELTDDILCIDSLIAFQQLLGKENYQPQKEVKRLKRKKKFEGKNSFALAKLYTRLTGKKVLNAHRAEIDVTMLIECSGTLGQVFVDWCGTNAKKFCDIPMMVPGKQIGT